LRTEDDRRKSFLNLAWQLINPRIGIIRKLFRASTYDDEPRLFHYAAEICNTTIFSTGGIKEEIVGGTSINEERAKVKAIGEAIERYSLSIYLEEHLIKASYNELGSKQAINPFTVVGPSKNQRRQEKYARFLFKGYSQFNWVLSHSLFDDSERLVPAQLVYVPYICGHNEPIIRLPITTGAAAGLDISDALYRGICEVVERDAFIITYLNRLSPPLVDLSSLKSDLIGTLLARFDYANLEVYVFNITTDIPIPVFLCLLIDRTGVGPAISVGAKASLNPEEAILGSIEESQQSRHWLRTLKQGKTIKPQTMKPEWENINNLEQRGLLWSDTSMIRNLSFLLKTKKKSLGGHLSNKRKGKNDKLKTCMKILRERNQACYYVDVTTLDVEELGLKVLKVIVPDLQPLYLDERFRYWGGSRLRNVPETLGYKRAGTQKRLNPIPHPFL